MGTNGLISDQTFRFPLKYYWEKTFQLRLRGSFDKLQKTFLDWGVGGSWSLNYFSIAYLLKYHKGDVKIWITDGRYFNDIYLEEENRGWQNSSFERKLLSSNLKAIIIMNWEHRSPPQSRSLKAFEGEKEASQTTEKEISYKFNSLPPSSFCCLLAVWYKSDHQAFNFHETTRTKLFPPPIQEIFFKKSETFGFNWIWRLSFEFEASASVSNRICSWIIVLLKWF